MRATPGGRLEDVKLKQTLIFFWLSQNTVGYVALLTRKFHVLCLLFLHFKASLLGAHFMYPKYLAFSFIQHLKGLQKIDLPGLL